MRPNRTILRGFSLLKHSGTARMCSGAIKKPQPSREDIFSLLEKESKHHLDYKGSTPIKSSYSRGELLSDTELFSMEPTVLSRYILDNQETLTSFPDRCCLISVQLLNQNFTNSQVMDTLFGSIRNSAHVISSDNLTDVVQALIGMDATPQASRLFSSFLPVLEASIARLDDFEIVRISKMVIAEDSKIQDASRRHFLSTLAKSLGVDIHRFSATDLFRMMSIFEDYDVELSSPMLQAVSRKITKLTHMDSGDRQRVSICKSIDRLSSFCKKQNTKGKWLDEFHEETVDWLNGKFKSATHQWDHADQFVMFKHYVKSLHSLDAFGAEHDSFVQLFFANPARFGRFYPLMTFKDMLIFQDRFLRSSEDTHSASTELWYQITVNSAEANIHQLVVLIEYLSQWYADGLIDNEQVDRLFNRCKEDIEKGFTHSTVTTSEAISVVESFGRFKRKIPKKIVDEFSLFMQKKMDTAKPSDTFRMLKGIKGQQFPFKNLLSRSADALIEYLETSPVDNTLFILELFAEKNIRHELLLFRAGECLEPKLRDLTVGELSSLNHSFFSVGIQADKMALEGKQRIMDAPDNAVLDPMHISSLLWVCAGNGIIDSELLQKTWKLIAQCTPSSLSEMDPMSKTRLFQAVSYFLSLTKTPYSFEWTMAPEPCDSIKPFLRQCADAALAHSTTDKGGLVCKLVKQVLAGEKSVNILEEDYSSGHTFGYDIPLIVDFHYFANDKPWTLAIDFRLNSHCAEGRNLLLGHSLLRVNTLKNMGYLMVEIPTKALMQERTSWVNQQNIVMNELRYVCEIKETEKEDDPNYKWEVMMKSVADKIGPE